MGKVRRRVQDLRIPSSSYCAHTASGTKPDLSHNESARLAADCLLSQGLDGYRQVLQAEGEVDFLSELEKLYILQNGRDANSGWMFFSGLFCFVLFFCNFSFLLSCVVNRLCR